MMDIIYQDSRRTLEKSLVDESVDPVDLPFLFLEAITEKFSDEQRIGGGGFGTVYKGKLSNGMVAVKKLHDKIEVLEENFLSEIYCLIRVKHKNIVRFLGYCSETRGVVAPYEGEHVVANVRQRLFCFEYLSQGSLDKYLTEASSGLQWRLRYQIIKGICEGVGYLHEQRIIHMDLKPQNILLDNSMVPKIADFGLSRRLSENQSRTITENIIGSWGYMAPEFLKSRTITFKTDIYSLGVIIMEILMGCKECTNIDMVLKSWTDILGTSESILEQVKVCAEIGINCMDDNPQNRPAIQDIIRRLDRSNTDISNSDRSVASLPSECQLVDEVMSMTVSSAPSQKEQSPLDRFDQHYRRARKQFRPIRISAYKIQAGEKITKLNTGLSESELLDVYPLKLRFPFEPNKRIECSLNLINRTDIYVAYWILPQLPDMYIHMEKVIYILCPLSTDTVNVTMVEQQQPPPDTGMFEILIIAMGSESDLKDLISSIGNDPKIDSDLLKRVEELGGEVHAAMLKAVGRPKRKISSAPMIVSTVRFGKIEAIDVHPTQPWILVGHGKYVSIWDYEKQAKKVALDVEEKAGFVFGVRHSGTNVNSVRFIPRKQWFAAGDCWGYVHVYACATSKEVKRLKAVFFTNSRSPVIALAIHPTRPYLLAACEGGWIRLWAWDMGWDCLVESKVAPHCALVKFNPKYTQTFSILHKHSGLQVRSIDPSPGHITTVKQISSHYCDDVFDEAGRDHVVIITDNGRLDIWDWQTGTRVHTLLGTGCFRYTAVACHPMLPLMAAGIKVNDLAPPVVRFWNSSNYRLKKTVSCMSGLMIKDLRFSGSRRLVIQTDAGIEVLEIDTESLACQE